MAAYVVDLVVGGQLVVVGGWCVSASLLALVKGESVDCWLQEAGRGS